MICLVFLHPKIPGFQIVVSRPNSVLSQQTIHQWKAYLFNFQMMHISFFIFIIDLMTGFVVQGHILGIFLIFRNVHCAQVVQQ